MDSSSVDIAGFTDNLSGMRLLANYMEMAN